MKFWPTLVDFTMTSHLSFSNHVTMVATFENLKISPGFLLNFRKVTKFQRASSKALRVMEKKLKGVPKYPPEPNRVKEILSQSTIMPGVVVIGPQIKEKQLIFYQNTSALIGLKVRG